MAKKSFLCMAMLVTVALILAACHQATTTSKELDCARSEILCVGLVTDLAGVDDRSFNQMAWEGMLKAQTEQVVDKVHYIETIDAKDYAANIYTLADMRYDVIMTIGAQYSQSTISAARRYPDILFVGMELDQTEGLPNLVNLVFHPDQLGFQAGALAAMLTRTNTIAAVLGPVTVPEVVDLKQSYEAGARYINPDLKIISIYYPDASDMTSSDPNWASVAASQAIQDGADIILDAGGITGNGALIEVASHPGLYCIGFGTDQWGTLPEAHPCLISSAMKLVNQGIFDIIKQARDASFPSGSYYSVSAMAPFHDFESVVPQTIKDEMNQIAAGLSEGSITTSDGTR